LSKELFWIRNHFKEAEIEEASGKTKRSIRKLLIKDNSPLGQERHLEDENPLTYMLLNIKNKNLKRKVTINKEGSSSKEKIEQEKTEQGKVKQPLITKPSSSIRRSVGLNKKLHEQPKQSPKFVDLEKYEMEPIVPS